MDTPKSLSWSLKHGYFITHIWNTDLTYCTVVVFNYDPPIDYPYHCNFLISTKWMYRNFPNEYNQLAYL